MRIKHDADEEEWHWKRGLKITMTKKDAENEDQT